MQRARTLRRAIVLVSLCATACSLTTSLDGLTGGDGTSASTTPGLDSSVTGADGAVGGGDATIGQGDDGALPSDGVAPSDSNAGDDGASDASTDAANDVTIDGDAGTVITDAGTDANVAFCATQSPAPLFCDDFDHGALDAAGVWDYLIVQHGTIGFDSTEYVSSPRAMIATTNTTTTNPFDVHASKVFSTLGTAALEMTLSFDLRVDAFDTTGNSSAVLGTIDLTDSMNTEYDLEIAATYASATTLSVVVAEWSAPGDGGATAYLEHAATTKLKSKTWTHVTLTFSLGQPIGILGGTKNTATLALNGVTAVPSFTATVSTIDAPPTILVGPSYGDPPSEPWTVLYDNVTFATKAL